MAHNYTFKAGDEVYLMHSNGYYKAIVLNMDLPKVHSSFCSVTFGNNVEMVVSKDDLITPEEKQLFDNTHWKDYPIEEPITLLQGV